MSTGPHGDRYSGVLLGESLRVGAVLDATMLRVIRCWRAAAGDTNAGQPSRWTFIEFEIEPGDADAFAASLEVALAASGGWYCSFGSHEDMRVVFAGRQFRYRRGDAAARRAVEDYARGVGVPESQLDWET